MSRRTIAILLIAFGLISIIGIGLWLWWPYRKTAAPVQVPPVVQPPGYSDDIGTATSSLINTPVLVPAYDRDQINLSERTLQDLLRRQAVDFAARVGTYSNSDEFAGMKQVYVDASLELRTYLETQRGELVKAHPLRGELWGQTARALSSRLLTPPPLAARTSVDVLVQLQIISGPDGQTNKSYREATITYTRINTTWTASRIVWKDIQL